MATNAALYYPYIHIRDVNWLKGTLLLFPQVLRMIPYVDYELDDSPEIQKFAVSSPNRKPLLDSADLRSDRVVTAQKELAEKLRHDTQHRGFRQKYDRKATVAQLTNDPLGFQIHARKLEPELTSVLRDTGLAWTPRYREPYDTGGNYLQVHRRVGEAVMSTLAVNCALADGLDIVGDTRSEELHRCLIEKDTNSVYDTWLGRPSALGKPRAATGEELFEFMIGFACDLTKLTPEALAAMGADREPIKKLVTQLRIYAEEIPKMDAGPKRRQLFEDAVSKVLKEWRADRKNMAAFWRAFFGKDLADTGAKFVEKTSDKVIGRLTAAGGVGVAISRSVEEGIIAGASALVIGLTYQTVKAFRRVRDLKRDSRYRYLTAMAKAGVVFRTDLHGFK